MGFVVTFIILIAFIMISLVWVAIWSAISGFVANTISELVLNFFGIDNVDRLRGIVKKLSIIYLPVGSIAGAYELRLVAISLHPPSWLLVTLAFYMLSTWTIVVRIVH